MLGSIAAGNSSGGRRDSRARRGAAEVRAGATHTVDAQPPPARSGAAHSAMALHLCHAPCMIVVGR
eukprot:852204-Pleurochrysis_carterae.AAC.1